MLSSANQDSGGIQFSKVKSSFMTCSGQEFSCQTILYKSSYYFTFPSTTYSSAFLSELIIESERPLSFCIPSTSILLLRLPMSVKFSFLLAFSHQVLNGFHQVSIRTLTILRNPFNTMQDF